MSYPTRLFISTALMGSILIAVLVSIPAQSQTAPTAATSASPTALPEVKPELLSNGYRLSQIIGSNVVNEQSEKVGVVDDVIMSAAPGTPFYIVSVGGFLGMGTRHVVVASTSIDLQGNRILLRGATVNTLKNLPIYAYVK